MSPEQELLQLLQTTVSPRPAGGVAWLGWTCGRCRFCASGRENLCDRARFTGYTIDGGFAEETLADARYCFVVPEGYPDLQAAPLLCAGLIGYRWLRLTARRTPAGPVRVRGRGPDHLPAGPLAGPTRLRLHPSGDRQGQDFARSLGAEWAGSSLERPPEPIDAAIIFAPTGALVPTALASVAKGGTVVCAGIHMSEIPGFSYDLLWEERSVRSVANLTRADGEEFMALSPQVPVHTEVETFPLQAASEALASLRSGAVNGAVVLSIAPMTPGNGSPRSYASAGSAPLADPNQPHGVHHRAGIWTLAGVRSRSRPHGWCRSRRRSPEAATQRRHL